ncbi:MAG: type II toxin-antitoxin system VapB family antitoxin [Gammaproteobacteria bacterium]|nr:type II toxin-antitoxin system VapB family antitoxin [Gammaproteobacteria bacterium]
MALHIHSDKIDELVASIVEITGESKTEAVTTALKQRLARLQRRHRDQRLADDLNEIALHCAALPVFDARPADEIIGYDGHGLPS